MKLDEINRRHLDELIARYPELRICRQDMEAFVHALADSVEAGGKVLLCGNGGSAADADHIVGELMKGFVLPRSLTEEQKSALIRADSETGALMAEVLQQGIPALSLCNASALNTAFANDANPEYVYAQQVMGLGRPGDALWCMSTSGNSKNAVAAAVAAKSRGLVSLAMTGEKESRLSRICDFCIRVPGLETYKVQELHLPVYHAICLILEDYFF